jgi:hypothetical protein
MRACLLIILCSLSAFAQESFEDKFKALEKAREDALSKWRTENRYSKLPNDDYVKVYNETWKKFSEEEVKLHADTCASDKSKCLTEIQIEEKKSQVRIVTGLMTSKNAWAREGNPEAEQKTAEENFNKCAKDDTDCDKLSERDRGIASSDKSSVDTDIAAAKKKMKEELGAFTAELAAKNADWNRPPMTAEAKEHFLKRTELELEKAIAVYKVLCEKYPEDESVCLSEDIIKQMKEATAGKSCAINRIFSLESKSKTESRKKIEENHTSEWNALPDPKDCKVLIEKDNALAEEPKKDTPVVTEEGDDEKSPRNYKPDTCKWVSDLPRKIVNGPSCGKTRSQICTGYVVCEQKEGGGKFIRMSTCGPDKCGDEDAVRCTKDMGYFSIRPAGENKLFMTKKIKDVLSGASEQ